jgi:hypothetical protein
MVPREPEKAFERNWSPVKHVIPAVVIVAGAGFELFTELLLKRVFLKPGVLLGWPSITQRA